MENKALPLYEWEYDTFQCHRINFKKSADDLGKIGWEIINVQVKNELVRVFLKRPKLFGVSIK